MNVCFVVHWARWLFFTNKVKNNIHWDYLWLFRAVFLTNQASAEVKTSVGEIIFFFGVIVFFRARKLVQWRKRSRHQGKKKLSSKRTERESKQSHLTLNSDILNAQMVESAIIWPWTFTASGEEVHRISTDLTLNFDPARLSVWPSAKWAGFTQSQWNPGMTSYLTLSATRVWPRGGSRWLHPSRSGGGRGQSGSSAQTRRGSRKYWSLPLPPPPVTTHFKI